ncbi:MAG: hypothetical protein M3N95_11025 [Actinomycetota bacterium]|nr:hypothetical protein [Actinomycetota bacterium]
MDRETRRRLGGAAYRGDAAEIMAVHTLDDARDVPQIAGQALLIALAQDMPGAAELATEVISRLAERDWDGDTELGVELRHGIDPSAGSLCRRYRWTSSYSSTYCKAENITPADGSTSAPAKRSRIWPSPNRLTSRGRLPTRPTLPALETARKETAAVSG